MIKSLSVVLEWEFQSKNESLLSVADSPIFQSSSSSNGDDDDNGDDSSDSGSGNAGDITTAIVIPTVKKVKSINSALSYANCYLINNNTTTIYDLAPKLLEYKIYGV